MARNIAISQPMASRPMTAPDRAPDEPSPWWTPAVYADRRPFLLARGRITEALRQWFRDEQFLEVETAILQRSPGNETHLHARGATLQSPAGASLQLYLHTTPEFSCKRLLAAGEPKLFTFARVFRNRERGPLHHPEFTLLEWYRANETYERLMADCTALLGRAAEAAGTRALTWHGRCCDPALPPERVTVAEAFLRFAGIDLMATLASGIPDRDG